jgi:hypothetical protein
MSGASVAPPQAMSRFALLIALASSACVARAGFHTADPPPAYAPSGGAPVANGPPTDAPHGNYAPGEDAQWFQADDYFVAEKPYDNKKLGVRVAKMITAATDQTKTEAQFLLANGEQIWTATFFRSRIPNQQELRVGVLAFCHAATYSHDAEPPKTKHDAREGAWIIAAITDTADLYKGRVTVGDASCAFGAIRIPLR